MDDRDSDEFIYKLLIWANMYTENHELLIKVFRDLETLPFSVGNHKSSDISFVIAFQKGLQSPSFARDTWDPTSSAVETAWTWFSAIV